MQTQVAKETLGKETEERPGSQQDQKESKGCYQFWRLCGISQEKYIITRSQKDTAKTQAPGLSKVKDMPKLRAILGQSFFWDHNELLM